VLYRFLFGSVAFTGAGLLFYSGAIPVFGVASSAGAYQQQLPVAAYQVRSALADADFRIIQTANPTGRMLELQRRDVEGAVRWSFPQDGKHVLELSARLEPIQEGLATKVVATAEPGADYATADLSSGLRDMAVVRALFAAALEYHLNPLMPEGQRLAEKENKARRDRRFVQTMSAQVLRDPGGPMRDAMKAQAEFGEMAREAEKSIEQMERAQTGWGAAPAGPGWSGGGTQKASRPATDLSKYD
jgi:hypothetical protein